MGHQQLYEVSTLSRGLPPLIHEAFMKLKVVVGTHQPPAAALVLFDLIPPVIGNNDTQLLHRDVWRMHQHCHAPGLLDILGAL